MRSRGPDGKGVFESRIKNNLFLKFFHTRLSIIDPLRRSHQPFRDNDGVLKNNGMIYNFKKLKKNLKKKI